MNLKSFSDLCDIYESTELDKVRLIAFYLYSQEDKTEFSLSAITALLDELHLPKPNSSRLKSKLKDSTSFVSTKQSDVFKLHGKEIKQLEKEYPQVASQNEEITCQDTILPSSLTKGTRGYIESLARQINASYQFHIFDGCSVLMRRLLEILIILSYENHSISSEIRNQDDTYVSLDAMLKNAKSSKTLSLSKDTKKTLDTFRELGNFAAHKIYYNARLSDIDQIKIKYRATIEELLYKSGLRT